MLVWILKKIYQQVVMLLVVTLVLVAAYVSAGRQFMPACADLARTTTNAMSPLGLIEMTRKRTRESLGQILSNSCPVCSGRGTQKSAETVCYEIFREILRVARAYENDVLLVMASQVVVDRLLDEESNTLAELEELVGKTVKFEVEPMYNQEQFDVVLY